MRRMRSVILAILAMLSMAACSRAPRSLEELLPREGVAEIRIFFSDIEAAASAALPAADSDARAILDALYAATPAPPSQEGYSPELRSTHRLRLSAGEQSATLYYDDAGGRLYFPETVKRGNREILTYRAFAAQIGDLLNQHAASAQVPFHPEEEPLVSIDALLRAEIVPEELEKPGDPIDFEMFSYDLQSEEPLYAVLTYQDAVPGLENGYLLIVAASGKKSTEGYTIDIASVEENDSYYVVRVATDAPIEGEEVLDQPSYSISCVRIDARRMTNDKIVVILGNADEILGLHRVPRAFFDELPTDMPPLVTPEPLPDGYID